MSAEVAEMMKPYRVRPWPALTEDNLEIAAAGWSWLHKYRELRRQGVAVDVGDGRCSKLLLMGSVVKRRADNQVFASFGNRLWAGLGMRLGPIDVQGQRYWRWQGRRMEFLHVYCPTHWRALPFTTTRLQGHGLVLQQDCVDQGVSIIVAALRAGDHKCLDWPGHQCV